MSSMNKEELGVGYIKWLINRNRVIHANGCWTTKGNPNIYRQIRIAQKIYSIHRISACLYLDLDLDDTNVQVNHKVECKYAGCWNPTHIYVGTQSDNIKDQINKGTHPSSSKTHCIRGHEFDQFKFKNGKIVGRRCSQCRNIYG